MQCSVSRLYKSLKKIILILFLLISSSSAFADPKMDLGLEVYNNKAQCGVCHVLQVAKSVGQIGPNLDMLKTPEARIISTVMNGIGVMPAFEGTLTTEEIEAVAYFVFNSTNNWW